MGHINALKNSEAILKSTVSSRVFFFFFFVIFFPSYASYLFFLNKRVECYNFGGGLATPELDRGGCATLKNRSGVAQPPPINFGGG
jgi:hypothetical protein